MEWAYHWFPLRDLIAIINKVKDLKEISTFFFLFTSHGKVGFTLVCIKGADWTYGNGRGIPNNNYTVIACHKVLDLIAFPPLRSEN